MWARSAAAPRSRAAKPGHDGPRGGLLLRAAMRSGEAPPSLADDPRQIALEDAVHLVADGAGVPWLFLHLNYRAVGADDAVAGDIAKVGAVADLPRDAVQPAVIRRPARQLDRFRPHHDGCWIADRQGERRAAPYIAERRFDSVAALPCPFPNPSFNEIGQANKIGHL